MRRSVAVGLVLLCVAPLGWVGAAPAAAQPRCPAPAPTTVDPLAAAPVDSRLRLDEAHRYATGAGQRVAVIDSGVHPSPLLDGRVVDGGSLIPPAPGRPDCEGHGTAVAGIIASRPTPAFALSGVAPDAEIMAIRQADAYLSDANSPSDSASLATAMRMAIAQRATVINVSIAGCYPAGSRDDTDLGLAVREAVAAGIVVVAAAGNTDGPCREQNPRLGPPVTDVTPAHFVDDVLTVASVNMSTSEESGHAGEISRFSVNGPWVDVAAPGTDIVSIGLDGRPTDQITLPGTGPRPIAGTSFATAYVSGLVALVRQRLPGLDPRQVMDRIIRTAQDVDPGQPTGIGVIDPVAALTHELPEEPGVVPQALDFTPREDDDDTPRTVALAGSAAALAALAVVAAAVVTLNRRRSPR